jgi:quercetin dioxygenase-like cupin family protein
MRLLWFIPLLAQAIPAGITRNAVLENETVMIARLNMAPNAREQMHTHPFSAVVVQLGDGDVEMQQGEKKVTERRPAGHVEFIGAQVPHAAANVGGAPFEVVTIALKPARRRGGDQPPTAARPGISRAPLLENADARVARATFEPGAREPVHAHPFDMVVVQLDPGKMELLVGQERTVKEYAAGEVIFLPREVPHSLANAGAREVTVISVTVR